MSCFQSEQAPAGNGDACGKNADTAQLQDQLTGALIGLARATEGNEHMLSASTTDAVVEGLFATQTIGNFDGDALLALLDRVEQEKRKLVPDCYHCLSSCGRTASFDMNKLRNAGEDIRALKSRILSGIRDLAACARHAAALGRRDEAIYSFLYKALIVIGLEDWGTEELLPILLEMDEMHRKCEALLG